MSTFGGQDPVGRLTVGVARDGVSLADMVADIVIAIVIVIIAAILGLVVHPVLWVIVIAAILWIFGRRGRW